MKSLICIAFKYDNLPTIFVDIRRICRISNCEKRLLITDIETQEQIFSQTLVKPSIEKTKEEIQKVVSSSESICFYVSGHGTTGGFVWYDLSLVDLFSLSFSDKDTMLICDCCNGKSFNLPFLLDPKQESLEVVGKFQNNSSIFVLINSSCVGINSKLSGNGSSFTQSLEMEINRKKCFKETILNIQKKIESCQVFSDCFEIEKISDLFFDFLQK